MCFDIVGFVRSVASLGGFRNERENRGAGTREFFLEKGAEEDYLYAVEEDPAKKESSYLAAGLAYDQSGGWRERQAN